MVPQVSGTSRGRDRLVRRARSVRGRTTFELACHPAFDYGRVPHTDCAVVPQPDEAQLAEIAIATSRTFVNLTGQDPVVAMLSFSTKGSGTSPSPSARPSPSAQPSARSIDGKLADRAASRCIS